VSANDTVARDRDAARPPTRRRRRWLRRIGATGTALIVIAAVLIAWLLLTASGRDTLLGRVVRLLPAGSLTWDRAEGSVYGPLTLYGVHYNHKGVDIRARRVLLEPSLRQLLGRRLRLNALEADDTTLDLPIDHTPQPLPSWPGSLPKFAIPFTLNIVHAHVRNLLVIREGMRVIDIAHVDGGVDLAPGVIGLRKLAVVSDRGDLQVDGRFDAGRNFLTRIVASAQLPRPRAGVNGAALRLRAGGDLDHFVLSVSGSAPESFAVRVGLDDGRAVPHWSMTVQAPRVDPLLIVVPYPSPARANSPATSMPYTIALQVDGVGGSAHLHGHIAQGERTLTVAPSQLAYQQGAVDAQPLALQILGGDVQLRGRVDLRPEAPAVDTAVQFAGLRWSATAAATPVQASGNLQLTGTFDAWTVKGTTALVRDKQRAQVALAGSGDRQQIRLDRFSARTPAGAMIASGQLRWAPQLAWTVDARLAQFDPGYFMPGFEGAVSGHAQSNGSNTAGALSLHAAFDQLSGQLRGRRLAGRGSVDWKAGVGRTDLDLHVGSSHVQASGQCGRVLDLVGRFDPLHLDDLLPDAAGALNGQVALHGNPSAPAIEAALQGSALRWKGFAAAHVSLDGKLPALGGDGALRVDATGIAGIPMFDALKLDIAGSEQTLRVDAQLSGSIGALTLDGNADHRGALWNGRINNLRYAPPQGEAWTLSAATAFRYAGMDRIHLDRTCLQATAASVCVDADLPHRATVQARALPLDLLDPWMMNAGLGERPDLQVQAYGIADIDAQVASAQAGWTGSARLHSAEGGLRMQPQLPHPLFGYSGLVAQAELNGERLQLHLDGALSAGGTVHAQLMTALARGAALSGDMTVDLRDITWLELFSTDIAAPKGQLEGRLVIGGTQTHPTLAGRIALDAFQTELPALGIAVHDGHVQLDADPNGAASVSGSLRSGDGILAIGGTLQWNNTSAPLVVTLKGQNVRIADTPELSAVASPDLQLQFASRSLSVRGRIDIPKAQMNLERLDSTVSPSPDVVVLDPAETADARSGPLAVDIDLTLGLGDDVKLRGFGLDGRLGGQLRVRRAPGNPMNATGALDISGHYAAYGQQLDIERGRLGYSGGGFDNPSLDILAQREFDDATVGVRVRGTALRPQTQIVSTPAMDPGNALAYLVIGRPLQSANADDTRQIGAASEALSVGGNLIAQQVGARLGLDQAGVVQSRALGGAAFTVGKYISPRVFLGYGVSLIGTGEVLTLKYLLRKGFYVQVDSGSANSASINWRVEK
jgi:translocation and assembly module TamB